MKRFIIKGAAGLMLTSVLFLGFSSCQKMERPEMNIIPDDTARMNAPLQMYLPFEESVLDSAQYQKGTQSNVTYVDGIRGKAYKGATNALVQYPSALKMANMTSFTVAFWMNTGKHTGGAQGIFALPNSSGFWGNLFAIIEGNDSPTDNSMFLKFGIEGSIIEFGGANRLPDMYGKWKHLAFTYDENTSKFSAYIDGQKMNLPASITDRKRGGNPMGKLAFQNPSKFVIGGFPQHIGLPNSTVDGWMLRYTGALDQFRVYTRAMSDAEITSLYNSKQ